MLNRKMPNNPMPDRDQRIIGRNAREREVDSDFINNTAVEQSGHRHCVPDVKDARGSKRKRIHRLEGGSCLHKEVFKTTGLPKRGIWTMSQRNRARALGKEELEPDVKRVTLFVP